MESMMTVRQVAELLGVHENWVYDQAASGALPSYKLGGTRRFHREEIQGWIAEHREAQGRAAVSTRAARAARVQRIEHEPEPARKPARRRSNREPAADENDVQPRLFEG